MSICTMMTRTLPGLLLVSLSLGLSASAAAAPPLVPFQGVLSDDAGAPVTGPTNIEFALYPSEVGGPQLWFGAQTVDLDEAGRFVAYLGAVSPLDLAIFRDEPELWLGVTVPPDGEMDRLRFGTAPYAGYAAYCGESTSLSGLNADTCLPGDVLKRGAGDDTWVCGADMTGDGGGGPVTYGAALSYDPVAGVVAVDQTSIEDWSRGVCYDTTQELVDALGGLLGGGTVVLGEGLNAAPDGSVTLAPPTTTTLGGVIAASCAAGEKMVGVDTDGLIVCALDLQGDGGGPTDPPQPDLEIGPSTALSGAGLNIPRSFHVGAQWIVVLTRGETNSTYTDIQRIPVDGGDPYLLADELHFLSGFDADDVHAYFTLKGDAFDNVPGGVYRVPKDGSTQPIQLIGGLTGNPAGMVVTDSQFFFRDEEGLWVRDKVAGAPALVAGATGAIGQFAIEGSDLYFHKDGYLLRLNVDGGVPKPLVVHDNSSPLTVFGGWVYIAVGAVIQRVPTAGGAAEPFAAAPWTINGLTAGENWLALRSENSELGILGRHDASFFDTGSEALGLSFTGGYLYWSDNPASYAGQIWRSATN